MRITRQKGARFFIVTPIHNIYVAAVLKFYIKKRMITTMTMSLVIPGNIKPVSIGIYFAILLIALYVPVSRNYSV
jgi:hypothetical protein